MSSHPSHHAGLPRLSDSSSVGYSGSSSYQHPPPPPSSQHQHQYQPQHQHQQPPPPSSSMNSSGHSYPSHNNQSIGSHHGPGNPGIGVSDLYHSSPGGAQPPPSPPPLSNSSVPSLPSMRTFDPLHQSSSNNLHSSPYPGPPTLPPGPLPFFSMPPPYGISPHHLPSFSSYGHHHGHKSDLRMPHFTIGARHKKEIKRRTKTGCMTCRKRRIKCDETHPTCNNCKKSKRDCAGYDPIFKQQPNNPAFLQATAHVSPHGSSTTTTTAPASGERPKSPPPVPYSSVVGSSAASNPSTNLAGIKSPSLIGGPPYSSSTSSSSSSAVSGYYNATRPSSTTSSSYQPSRSSNSNGSQPNGSSYNSGSYSSRPVIVPFEYPGTSLESSYKAFAWEKELAERAHHRYPGSTTDSRDSGRYS